MRPSKSPVRGAPQPAEAVPPPPDFERAGTSQTVVGLVDDATARGEALGGSLSLDGERPDSRASQDVVCELTRANLAEFATQTTGRSSLTPARKATRRHSHSTEDVTPTRRSERIAKQKRSSTGGA